MFQNFIQCQLSKVVTVPQLRLLCPTVPLDPAIRHHLGTKFQMTSGHNKFKPKFLPTSTKPTPALYKCLPWQKAACLTSSTRRFIVPVLVPSNLQCSPLVQQNPFGRPAASTASSTAVAHYLKSFFPEQHHPCV